MLPFEQDPLHGQVQAYKMVMINESNQQQQAATQSGSPITNNLDQEQPHEQAQLNHNNHLQNQQQQIQQLQLPSQTQPQQVQHQLSTPHHQHQVLKSRIGEDPRDRSDRYFKKQVKKFDVNKFDFIQTQFLIDDNYIGDPPKTQISVENLNDNVDENFLGKEFSFNGKFKIKMIQIVREPKSRQHLNMAKVEFDNPLAAQNCVDKWDGKAIMGKFLKVYKDLRFTTLNKKIEDVLNPKPQPTPITQLPPVMLSTIPSHPLAHSLSSGPLSSSSIATPSSATATPLTPIVLPQTPTLNHPPGSHLTTPGFPPSSTNPSSRQSLAERIALMKQSHILAAPVPNSQQQQQQQQLPLQTSLVTPSPMIQKQFTANHHPQQHPYPPYPSHHHQSQHHHHHSLSQTQYPSHHNQHQHSQHYNDPKSSKFNDHYRGNRSPDRQHSSPEEDWNKLLDKPKEVPKIELTERQIEDDVLPRCYDLFHKELTQSLVKTILKRLIEKYGYPYLDEAQTNYKRKLNEINLQKEKVLLERKREVSFLERFMSKKARTERPVQPERPKFSIVKEMINTTNQTVHGRGSHQIGDRGDNLRRKNRSSAIETIMEPDRRGSRNASYNSDSDDDDSSSVASSSSRSSSMSSSSTSSSRSNFSSSSSSSSGSSSSSDGSSSSSSSRAGSGRDMSVMPRPEYQTPVKPSVTESQDEKLAVDALLSIGQVQANKSSNISKSQDFERKPDFIDDEDDEVDIVVKRQKASVNKRRKKHQMEIVGGSVASEYRSAKRFASGAGTTAEIEDIENSYDENLAEDKPEAKFLFPKRSDEESKRMLFDLQGTLTEEDVKYLQIVHQDLGGSLQKSKDIEIPFGTEFANKLHLNGKKQMIEGKTAEGHPKWWRGCSRCDVIEMSEKHKVENEEDVNYEDLTKAPIKSHVIQAVGASSRRDQRGDQRRIAAANEHLDADIIKLLKTSTLQMRAKNLRFSRSKIHKWGLFACEKIASGDAVIEYVGEKIRPSLADHREKIVYTNLPTHDGSSYFFRVDYDVIDATLKGNKARFINHSCNPNCIAKVIKHDNGSNSIVIYAKQVIQEDEEITYDYKFPREETDQKIRCNCKAPNCQKYLN